uniref:Uncharacterized protein n=1 Tax=Arundo donax TaxID=35708 RepID=A0A0A9HSE9_ARUDO
MNPNITTKFRYMDSNKASSIALLPTLLSQQKY